MEDAVQDALPHALAALRAAAVARAVLQHDSAALAMLDGRTRARAVDALLTGMLAHACDEIRGGALPSMCLFAGPSLPPCMASKMHRGRPQARSDEITKLWLSK